jgi:hypothetical protein
MSHLNTTRRPRPGPSRRSALLRAHRRRCRPAPASRPAAGRRARPGTAPTRHGYFHDYLAPLHGDWAMALCDNCYADLHSVITVTVRFFSARSGGSSEPFAAS